MRETGREALLLYILIGEDDFSQHQALEEIKRSVGDPTLLAANTTTLDGQQAELSQLRMVCQTLPFLAERRLVIVRGLFERFEPKSKPKGKTTSRLPSQTGECKSFVDCLSKIPDSTILVLVDSAISSHNPLFVELSKKAEVKSFPPLRGTKLRQWIGGRVKAEGGSISPEAVNLLARVVGSHLWIMANEINKLVLFTAGRRIEEEDVKTVVS